MTAMAEFDPKRAAEQLLEGWRTAGLGEIPRVSWTPVEPAVPAAKPEPTRQRRATPAVAAAAPAESPTPTSPAPATGPRGVSQLPTSPSTMPRSQRLQELDELSDVVAKCGRCEELVAGRTQTVFGVGNPEADVMFVGEAPGADEDRQGEPFVGRAGQLLNRIIAACGWTREELYICNILRCRPPGNRNPTSVEAANCREYLNGQIHIVDPSYIVCWGTVAARNLLDREDPIGRLRGRFFEYGRAKVLCTYHPSYLLRNPSAKKLVWEDMQILLSEMGITPPVA